MPRARIVVADSIANRYIRAAYPFDRIAVIDPTDRATLGNATVIGAPGGVVSHRSGGIAVLVIRSDDTGRVLEAMARIPDPVLIVAYTGPAPDEVARAVQERSGCALVQVGAGLAGCAILDAVNEPGRPGVAEVRTVAPAPRPRAKRKAKTA